MLKRNNTSYPINLAARIKKIHEVYKKLDSPMLMFHQYLIRELFTDPIFGIGNPVNSRGFLIHHGVGVGKTILAASVMLALIDLRQPILLLPKSLQQNFLNTIDKIIEDRTLADKIKSRMNFVSLDAYNSGAQMKAKSGSLNGKLLIVDEAHNFFKAIVNSGEGNTNAKTLFNMIMSASDLRILFLTGTPITKNPFELVCAVNMLTGQETLPSNYETFEDHYIENGKLKNKNKLQNRLFGLISYVTFDLPRFPGDESKSPEELDRPEDLGIKVERVEMSEPQYVRYISIRDREEKLAMRRKVGKGKAGPKRPRDTPNMSLPTSGKGGSSYFIESRMISNFSVPLEIIKEDVNKIDKSHFTKENSPKIYRLIQNIKRGNKPALVYSQFIKGGLDAVAKYLQIEGFEEWLPSYASQPITHKLRYAVIAGRVSSKDRSTIVEAFNKGSNMYGDVIATLLVSETGAEGLDLKHIREVHILEPYWDMARIYQIQGRAIRKGSHRELPPTDRNVKTIIYTSVPNKEMIDTVSFKEDDSIDIQFLNRAQKRMSLIRQFEKAIKEVSIECIANNYGDCRVCLPDNTMLFNPNDVNADISDSNDPCKEYTSDEKVKVKSIIYNEEKYYYKKEDTSPLGYDLYVYNKELDGYVEFPLNTPIASNIIQEIQKIPK